MERPFRRATIAVLSILPIVFLSTTSTTYCAGISLQSAPAIEFRLEQGGGNPEAGHDFWVAFSVLKELWTKEILAPLHWLGSFQCGIGFDPRLVEPVGAEPGGMIASEGWTTELKWDKSNPVAMVHVSLKSPPGDRNGASGYGVLLRVKFRALETAGGPAKIWTKPDKYVLDSKDNRLFAFTGLATNVKGEDISIRGPGHAGPGDGLGETGYFTIVPRETRIVAANCLYQTVRISLDRATDAYRDATDARWKVTLSDLGVKAKDWVVLPIREIIPIGDDALLQFDTSGSAKFALNDKLKLSYNAERALGQGRQTLAGETPIYNVSPDTQPPQVKVGPIGPIKLSNQGRDLKSYSSKTPPAFDIQKVDGLYDWIWILFGPDGSYLNVSGAGPFDLYKEIGIDPSWPDGGYRLLVVAFGGDYTRTSFSTASVGFTVKQER